MLKNVATKLYVFCWNSTTGEPQTGDSGNLTAYAKLDNGSVTVLADTSATEMSSTHAPGWYQFDLAQGETNGDLNLYTCVSTTAHVNCMCSPPVVNTLPTTGVLAPATAGRTLVVDSSGLADANMVKLGPSGSGTAQTARDVGLSVLLSSGTGTGQLDFTSGVAKANATQWLGGTIPAVNVTGVPLVDLKYTLGTISPATAGYVALDWGQVTNKTTANALTGTTISTSQVVASVSGAVGSVTGAVASVTGNVTGSVGSVTAAVTLPSIPSNWITAAGIASGALVVAVWDGAISGHTTSGTFGGALNAAGSAGDPWGTNLPGVYAAGTAGYIVGNGLTGNVPQTGDSFAIANALTRTGGKLWVLDGSGNAVAPAGTALSTAQWTNSLATNLGTLAGHDPGSTLASAANITTLSSHGDSTWATATGFATPTNITNLQTHGDSTWSTATGFALASVWTPTIAGQITSIFNKLPAGNIADEALIISATNAILTAVGTPMQVGTQVIVSASGLNNVLIAGKTLPNAIKYIGAAVAGECTGAGTGTETYDDFSGSTAFIATIDTDGNRTGMTYS